VVAAIAADYIIKPRMLLMNTASKLGPTHKRTEGRAPGLGILVNYNSRYTSVHLCISKSFFISSI
jgi:hypothetical protein